MLRIRRIFTPNKIIPYANICAESLGYFLKEGIYKMDIFSIPTFLKMKTTYYPSAIVSTFVV